VAAAVLATVGLTGAQAASGSAVPQPAPGAHTFTGTGDWDGDGKQDIVLGDVAGDWWVYPGANIRGYSGQQPVKIAQGYYGTTFAGMGDWDGDHRDDIIFRQSNGDLMVYPGGSVRGPSGREPSVIGWGWNGITFAGVGDWDHDGHDDVMFRRDAAYYVAHTKSDVPGEHWLPILRNPDDVHRMSDRGPGLPPAVRQRLSSSRSSRRSPTASGWA